MCSQWRFYPNQAETGTESSCTCTPFMITFGINNLFSEKKFLAESFWLKCFLWNISNMTGISFPPIIFLHASIAPEEWNCDTFIRDRGRVISVPGRLKVKWASSFGSTRNSRQFTWPWCQTHDSIFLASDRVSVLLPRSCSRSDVCCYTSVDINDGSPEGLRNPGIESQVRGERQTRRVFELSCLSLEEKLNPTLEANQRLEWGEPSAGERWFS